jgi:hypothetical protein
VTRAAAPLGAFLLAFTLLAVGALPAAAQSDTGEIVITVVDATTKTPVANARTILVGPQTASSLTTKAGVIRYTDAPAGIYRVRVLHPGYQPGVSSEFDVLSDRSVDVRVELAMQTGGLKVIGSVTARSRVSIGSNEIADDSPIRRLSDSLTDALDKLAGVSVTQSSNDPDSPVTVSLNGHDESQTAITLDGIPMSGPGAAADLRQLGTDLFTGSSVSFSPTASGLGGSVNFRTLQPTQALQLHLNGTTGTFDRSNYQVAATGGVGNLSLALEHTWRGSNNPLTFQDYLDQSGLAYPHGGESTGLGDFLKFRYRLGDERTTISGTALTNNRYTNSLCTQDTTLLPCGIGPDNFSYGRSGFAYGTVQSLIGTVATTFTAYTSSSAQNTDDANRYVAEAQCNFDLPVGGQPTQPILCPSLSANNTVTHGFASTGQISEGRHTLTLSASTYTSRAESNPIVASSFQVPFTNAASSTTAGISDTYKLNDAVSLAPNISVATTTGLGTTLLGGLGATWRPNRYDTFGGSASFGSAQPALNAVRSYSDPASARFDCNAGTAAVSGPGDSGGGGQSAATFDANWSHQFHSGSSVSADLYTQVQTGQLINAIIAEPASYFPAGYQSALASLYNAANVCGAAAAAPTIYVDEPVGGTRRVYQGINVSGRFGAGRYLVILPNYSINVARLTAASARLLDGPSTTIVGEQLPGRPVHRAGVTLDGLLPRNGTELLFNAQYTGGNNNRNLGSYVVASAGISHAFGPGRVTLFENNIFNTYAGDFTTDLYDQPLPLSNGDVLRGAAQPLLPRTIALSYAVNLGAPPPLSSIARANPLAQQTAAPAPVPAGSSAPGRGLRLQSVPPPPGVDPLSLATSRDSCSADAQTDATPLFDALKSYVTAYEAKTTLPDVAQFEIVAHPASRDASVPYYLELRPKLPGGASAGNRGGTPGFGFPGGGGRRNEGSPGGAGGPGGVGGPPPGAGGPGGPEGGPPPESAPGAASENTAGGAGGANAQQRAALRNSPQARAFRAFLGCSYVTALSNDDAKAKGIETQSGRPGFFYVPKLGLVFVRPLELPQGGGSLKSGH